MGALPSTFLGLLLGAPHKAMPIYLMSLMRMLRVVRLRLEQIQRDFLWDVEALEKKLHLVKWAIVCSDKKKRWFGC